MQQTFIAWPASHNIRLKCKANGSKPIRYQWLKDGLPSIQRRLQPRLKTNMWYLKLKDLVTVDSGRYTCVVSNAFGSINHTYTLRVVGMIASSNSAKVCYYLLASKAFVVPCILIGKFKTKRLPE